MEFKVFEGIDKKEISMIEVARAILTQRGEIIDFSDLVNQIQNYLEKEDIEIREVLPQFYTDLNIDGSFISLGENRWGLREWYPIDSIDEEVSGIDEEEDETVRRKKRKKVNAFIATDEDAIDYNDDDPEDAEHEEEELYDDEDDSKEIKEYTTDLTEIGDTEDVEVEVEGLTIVDEEDLEDSDLFDDEEEEELEEEQEN